MNALSALKELLKFQIETLKDYFEESHRNILAKQEAFKEAMKDTGDFEISVDEQYMMEIFIEDNSKYFREFPCYYYESSLIMAYSFFEISLSRICNLAIRIHNARNPTEQIADVPNSSSIKTSKGFIENKCRIPLNIEKLSWRKLERIQTLRNFIAHDNLDLKQSGNNKKSEITEAIDFINDLFGECIAIDRGDKYIITNYNFIIQSLNLIEQYLYFVIEQIANNAKVEKNPLQSP